MSIEVRYYNCLYVISYGTMQNFIILFHEGFADDQFSIDDNPSVGNRVEFYNDLYTIPCAVERYDTTSERIICRMGLVY